MFSEEGFNRLINVLTRLDIPHSVHKVIPFTHHLEPEINPKGPVIVMGTYTLAEIAKNRGWEPGSFLNDNFNFIRQRYYWKDAMLNHMAAICHFDCVPIEYVPFFIRPVTDSKAFTGQVIDWKEYEEWRNRILSLSPEDYCTLKPDTEVMICSPKTIYSEYRTWIIDEKVVTASQYKMGSTKYYSSLVDQPILDFAEYNAQIWSPARAYCMDVAWTPGGLKIVEVNNINSSGFYEANMQKLVEGLEGMVW